MERRPPRRLEAGIFGGEERKKGFAERSLWAAEPHEGASAAGRGYMLPFARVETRADFAATYVAARAGAKSGINMVLE